MAQKLEPAKRRHQVHGVCDRRKRSAARLVVFTRQAMKAVRICVEVKTNASLILRDRCLAARAPRSVRFVTAKRSVKRHETFPRKTPVEATDLHERSAVPRPIWSQLVDGARPGSRGMPSKSGSGCFEYVASGERARMS